MHNKAAEPDRAYLRGVLKVPGYWNFKLLPELLWC